MSWIRDNSKEILINLDRADHAGVLELDDQDKEDRITHCLYVAINGEDRIISVGSAGQCMADLEKLSKRLPVIWSL